MNTYYGPFNSPVKCRMSRCLMLVCLPLLSEALMAAERELLTEQEPVADQQITNATPGTTTPDTELPDPTPYPIPLDTHATRQAPQDLLIMAVHEPQNLIGKTLTLDDGTTAVTVGPVLDVRRRLQDQELYLIVDAREYFNTAVQYAVAVKDLDRIEQDKLVIPEAPGMHLQGLDYYPDDYTDVKAAPLHEAAGDE